MNYKLNELKIFRYNYKKQQKFGFKNLHFNGRSNKCDRLPNTCNVSFISSDNYKGYLILSQTKRLEASTGACCHSGELKPSKIILAMNKNKNVASNSIRLSVGRDTTKNEIDLIVEDLENALNLIESV